MLPPNNISVAQLARETGIPKDTLYTWRRNMRKGGTSAPGIGSPGNRVGSPNAQSVPFGRAMGDPTPRMRFCTKPGVT
ncbi:MAG: transposase [Gammaproteobacteria bacterium]